MPAMQALVPRALRIQAEHRPHAAVRAVADDVPWRRNVFARVTVPLERLKVSPVEKLVSACSLCLCHCFPPFLEYCWLIIPADRGAYSPALCDDLAPLTVSYQGMLLVLTGQRRLVVSMR